MNDARGDKYAMLRGYIKNKIEQQASKKFDWRKISFMRSGFFALDKNCGLDIENLKKILINAGFDAGEVKAAIQQDAKQITIDLDKLTQLPIQLSPYVPPGPESKKGDPTQKRNFVLNMRGNLENLGITTALNAQTGVLYFNYSNLEKAKTLLQGDEARHFLADRGGDCRSENI